MVLVDMPAGAVDEDIRRITVDEYLVIAATLDWKRTELIDGVVYNVAAQHNLHGRTVMHVAFALGRRFPENRVWVSPTVRMSERTAVEPDVLITDEGVVVDEKSIVPAGLVRLAVEVTVTGHRRDLGRKLALYARAGVPEYWVIDPREGEGWLRRYTAPVDGTYLQRAQFDVGFAAEQLDVAAVIGAS